ncbi:hypothetical protein BGZ98_006703 [Dissophora globulifera]|nr:hypothetical protein BGZ98_006703 [Dissophora globulifera]
MVFVPSRSLLNKPGPASNHIDQTSNITLAYQDSHSNRHSKDALYHKDAHLRHLRKQQQIQLEREKKYRQQLQLQQAHQEFCRTGAAHLRQLNSPGQIPVLLSTHDIAPPAPSVSLPSNSTSTTSGASSSHLYHHNHPFLPTANLGNAESSGGNSSSTDNGLNLHQHLPPHRTSQFSEWMSVKERERARLLSNMARVRGSQTPLLTVMAAQENLQRLSQRIHQRRTRARETILYDLHQGVKSVEAQVHKQVEMVLSRLKDAPGSKYAFALTHTFLTQLPQALSNTILPSAISAVADTVAGRTTNSLTTLRGRAGLDEFDEDEEEEEEDEEEDLDEDYLEGLEDMSYQQQMELMRMHQQQQDPSFSLQILNEFGTIALASPSSATTSDYNSSSSSAAETSSSSSPISPSLTAARTLSSGGCNEGAGYSHDSKVSMVSISSAGASELLAASSHHNYSTAASQVLSAALPSFIPSMVAPIVCVFSYPSSSSSKTNPPNPPSHSSLSPPSTPQDSRSSVSNKGKGIDTGVMATRSQAPQVRYQSMNQDGVDFQTSIKADPESTEVASTAWTDSEREALLIAVTEFQLQGHWSRIREIMHLHRTEKEIENEYQRLHGDHHDDDDDRMAHQILAQQDNIMTTSATACLQDHDLVPIKQESDVEDDGDADDEAEATMSMRLVEDDRQYRASESYTSTQSSFSLLSHEQQQKQGAAMLMDIEPLAVTSIDRATARRPSSRHGRRHLHHQHRMEHVHRLQSKSPIHHSRHRRHDDSTILKSLSEKPLRVVKKSFMADKNSFTLEDIPMRI